MMGTCCCCPDFIVRSSDQGVSSTSAWRRLRTSGTYPTNRISMPNLPRMVFNTDANYFTVDYRNKLIFTRRVVGGNYVLASFPFDLNGTTTDLLTFTSSPSLDIRGLCCDWLSRRIIYPKGISSTAGSFPPNVLGSVTYELRTINYDGSGDTSLGTFMFQQGGSDNTTQFGWPAWEPTNGYIFFTEHTFITRPPSFDSNQYAYLERVNGDGSGGINVASYENTTENHGDAAIRGITTCPSLELVIWVSLEQHNPSDTIYTINAANYDGSGKFTVYSTVNFNILSNPVFSTKENKLYFLETVGSSLYWRRCDVTPGAIPETIFDDAQLSAILPENYAWAGNGTMLGCGRENVKGSYFGGSQGTFP